MGREAAKRIGDLEVVAIVGCCLIESLLRRKVLVLGSPRDGFGSEDSRVGELATDGVASTLVLGNPLGNDIACSLECFLLRVTTEVELIEPG